MKIFEQFGSTAIPMHLCNRFRQEGSKIIFYIVNTPMIIEFADEETSTNCFQYLFSKYVNLNDFSGNVCKI